MKKKLTSRQEMAMKKHKKHHSKKHLDFMKKEMLKQIEWLKICC